MADENDVLLDPPAGAPDAAAPIPTEVDQQQQAREARAAAPPGRRQAKPVAPPSTEAKPVAPGQNVYDQFDGDPDDDGIALAERNRLNTQDAFYRGSLAGSARLSAMAHIFQTPDTPEETPERKAINKQVREEYQKVVADLAAYDEMPSFGTTMEAIVSLGGQLEGTLISPESWVGWASKGGTALARTVRAGVQQGVISGVTDPAVQALNVQAGVREGFDPLQTAMAAGMGLGIGTTAHAAGEGLGHIVGQKMLRRQIADLAASDSAFADARTAITALDPDKGVQARPRAPGNEAPSVPGADVQRGTIPADDVRVSEPGPEHSYQDAIARKKQEGQEADRLANAEAKERGEAPPAKQPGQRDSEARQAVLEEEVGPQVKALRDEGLPPNDVDEIGKLYDRQAGEHPQVAFVRAVDQWAEQAERDAIQVIDGPDSKFAAELAEFNRAYEADMRRESPAGTGEFRPDEQKYGAGSRALDERGIGDIPFEQSQVDARPQGGRPAEPSGGAVPGPEGRAAEGGQGAPGGGERAGSGGGAGRTAAADAGATAQPAGGDRVRSERTAQGEQTLIPGVEPVTERQRVEAEMNKPMRGGDAPAGGLFDADARAQGDLLGLRATGGRPDLEALAQRKNGGALFNEQERDAAGTPGAPSPAQDLGIRSLQQMSMDLAKVLDVPVRAGRVEMRGALGTFNRRSGVIRVKEVPDFEVVTHEAGHAIEAKVGADLTDLMDDHSYELMRLDYEQGPGGQRVNEGFAEYVRLRIGNPAAAANFAPAFNAAFDDFMRGRAPDILKAVDDAAVAYRAYLDAPSTDAVAAVRRSVQEEPTRLRKVIDALRLSELPNTVKSVIQTVYDTIWDGQADLDRAVRSIGRLIGEGTGQAVDLKAADNPAVLMRLFARTRQAATRDMIDGVRPYHETTPTGPSLANAISEALGAPSVWGKWNPDRQAEFSSYLIARRAEYLWRKFDDGKLMNPPTAFSAADARMAMAEFEKVNPTFKNASDMVHGYTRELLRKQRDGGLITEDLYQTLLKDEFYVPFMRDMSDKPGAGSGTGSGATTQVADTVKRMQGSSRDIKDPIESLMMQTFLVNRTLAHNDIIKSLVAFSERAGIEGGRYAEKIPASQMRKYTFNLGDAIEAKAKEIGMDPDEARVFAAAMGDVAQEDPVMGSFWKMEQANPNGEPIIFYKDGGETKAVRVMNKQEGYGIYEILTKVPEPVSDLFSQIIGVAASVKRAGITTNPTFIVSNYIRDQVAAGLLRSDYIPIVSGIRGISDEFRQANNAVLYGYAGGVAGGAATGPVEHAAAAEIDALAKKGYAVQRLTSIKGLLELASVTEAGTRNSIFGSVFQQKKLQGLSDYEAMVEAAFQSQDFLDFSRHGSRTMWLRTVLPFFNATLQGLDKAYRTALDPIVERMRHGETFTSDSAEFKNALNVWLKAGAIGGSLGAWYAATMWDNEAYRDATPYFKGTHFIVPWGNKIVVIPKPFELSTGFTAGEYAMQAIMSDAPKAGRQFLESLSHTFIPPNPVTELPLISTAIELTVGKSQFTGRDIVPDQYKALPDPMQFNDRTSEMAKWMGQQTGLSPMKIEYGIGSFFGTWGRDVMALSQGVNEESPAASFDDSIFLRRFVKDPTRSSDVSTQYWNFMGRSTGKYNQDVSAYDNLVKGFQDDQAKEFLSKLPENERAFTVLKSAANEDGKPVFKADEKRLHPLQRSYDAVTLLNGMRKELAENVFAPYQTGDRQKLNPEMRRDLLENMREMAQMEMRNALVMLKEPGYGERPMLKVEDVMERIRNISPAVADEIATRYATARIYKTSEVEKLWGKVRKELNQRGSEAEIRDYASDAKGAGYEFEGDRVRKPLKRRVMIGASPVAPP